MIEVALCLSLFVACALHVKLRFRGLPVQEPLQDPSEDPVQKPTEKPTEKPAA
jgi:hypothetical protein